MVNSERATVGEALRAGKARLLQADLDLSELEAESLLMHALGTDRASLYRDLKEPIGDDSLAVYQALLERRAAHEPTAYIVGMREFFGIELRVTPAALIPRAETEALVEAVIEYVGDRDVRIVDVGTGCGAIAIALAVSLPRAKVIATERSDEALALARENAERAEVGARIELRSGDLLDPLGAAVDVIAANLPYVTTGEWERLPPELRDNEPRLAFDGGLDGLALIRKLVDASPAYLNPGGAVFCEAGDGQAEAVAGHARAVFPGARILMRPDLAGTPRVLCVYP
jgi:release factor glutamine methyltransferase